MLYNIIMIKRIIDFFDKFEDKIRNYLSKRPVLYALVGGAAIVLFWRGIWHLADDFGMSSVSSLIISIIVMLATGTFVSFFIGEQILISGLKAEKRIVQKTKEEIRKEEEEIKQRLDELKLPASMAKSGYLKYYANFVGSADRGAVRNI